MEDADIGAGDILIVDHGAEISDECVCIVREDEDLIVKRLHKRKLRLVSENEKSAPEVCGVATHVIRQL